MDLLTVIIGLVTGVIVPAVGLLFKKFSDGDKALSVIDEKLDHEREQRRLLELMIAREYVSRMALKEIMEPFAGKLSHLDRMIERIASRLQIPAVGQD